jgi:hypothetical protein
MNWPLGQLCTQSSGPCLGARFETKNSAQQQIMGARVVQCTWEGACEALRLPSTWYLSVTVHDIHSSATAVVGPKARVVPCLIRA